MLRRVAEGSLLDRLPALELLALANAGLGSHDESAAASSEMAELATLLGTTYNAAHNAAELSAIGAGGLLVTGIGPSATLILGGLGPVVFGLAGPGRSAEAG